MGASFDLSGKVALVTGAVGLLGKEHCKALRVAGADVVVADVNEAAVNAFATELRTSPPGPLSLKGEGGKVLGVTVDVTSKASLENARDKVLGAFDRLDVLVNNAAINDMFESPQAGAELSKFENYPLDLWQRSLDVNVTGVFLCCQVLGTEMAKAGRGSIINVASTYGLVAPDQSIYIRPDGTQTFFKSASYPATKGAVLSFSRFLAAYWGNAGVRVNTLCPGGIENGQEPYFLENYGKKTPLGRMGKRDEMGGAIVFLASDASSYMTGSAVVVDGGWTAW
ncbi:MAG: SDR family oxidoreductase [Polyangiaceae bacterium]|nr:SDR family oxidoreductase [Polyangiaceae bacterium]